MSESNLNLIINNFAVDKLTVDNIAEIYKPRHGYIYCLYNKCFQYYGDNVYKLGTTNNLTRRMNGYITCFIEKSEYKHHSKQLIDCCLAEQMLFDELKQYRVTNDREFFNCEYNIILNAFTKVEKFFSEYNTTEKIIQYYLDNKNNKKEKNDSTLKFINIYIMQKILLMKKV